MKEATFTKLIGPDGKEVWARDLDFEVINEGTGQYKLEDGTILEAKIVVGKISMAIEDIESGQPVYTDKGEPAYNLRHSVFVSVKVPPERYKKS